MRLCVNYGILSNYVSSFFDLMMMSSRYDGDEVAYNCEFDGSHSMKCDNLCYGIVFVIDEILRL